MINRLLTIPIYFALTLIIFLPILLIVEIINFFSKVKFYRISPLMGGTVELYPYLIKKKNGYYKNQIHIFFIDQFHDIRKKKDLYNLIWMQILYENLQNTQITNEKIFLIYNYFLNYFYKLILKLRLEHLILKVDYFRKKNNLSEKDYINIYEKVNMPLIKYNEFSDQEFDKFINLNSRKLISICNRDKAYKQLQYPSINSEYHDYRNFDVSDFKTAIDKFQKKNYFIARMGNIVEKKLYHKNHCYYEFNDDKVKNSKLELMIIKKSEFFVGPESGLDKVAIFFNKPIVYLNVHHLLYRPHFVNRCIFVPSKLFNLKTNKFLTFKELLDEKYLMNKENVAAGFYFKTQDFKENYIKIINNSNEDICSAMDEMEFYLKNNFELNSKDKELQNKFWNLFGKNYPINKTHIISPNFLKQNLDLLN